MTIVLYLLVIQGLMGAFDTLYHHELTVALPSEKSAQHELCLHAVRFATLCRGICWPCLV
ncbi:hypothetical protein [Iodobacter fluviatilis]|uniref:hypothetical protein n=1 Tax=Iodobacter fluviatilis TaxID=537 RepID=UPI001CAA864D|nr:hypothetical protein [Iodobacter fluviatilis]